MYLIILLFCVFLITYVINMSSVCIVVKNDTRVDENQVTKSPLEFINIASPQTKKHIEVLFYNNMTSN